MVYRGRDDKNDMYYTGIGARLHEDAVMVRKLTELWNARTV